MSNEFIKIVEQQQHPEEIRPAMLQTTKREYLDSVTIPNGSLSSSEFGSDVVDSSEVSSYGTTHRIIY
jgi:hypothetical protein